MLDRVPPPPPRSAVVDQMLASMHRDFIDEVREAIERHPVVVVGMAQNPFVKRARQALDAAGIAHHYIGHGSYLSGWRRRLALKLWTGSPTFPMVFVRGTLIGGASDLAAALADRSLQTTLNNATG